MVLESRVIPVWLPISIFIMNSEFAGWELILIDLTCDHDSDCFSIEMRIHSSLNHCMSHAARPPRGRRAMTSQRGGATLHLDTSRDVTPRARSGAAGGAPGMQQALLQPRNKPVQVLGGRSPGNAAHGGREKRLRTSCGT